jgi:hypothetical protein
MLQIKKTLSYVVLVFSAYALCINGQSRPSIGADNCEMTLAKLDLVYHNFKGRNNKKSILLVEGGRASNERLKYTSRRLNDAIGYFDSIHGMNNTEIRIVLSTKASALGFLRFYVDGEFIEEIWFRRNSRLCLDTGA